MAKVLVYEGPGTAPAAVEAARVAMTQLCAHAYDVQLASVGTLAHDPWEDSTRLVVLPAGGDGGVRGYVAALSRAYVGRPAAERLCAYVARGGALLAFGCGAAYLCRTCADGAEGLAVWDGACAREPGAAVLRVGGRDICVVDDAVSFAAEAQRPALATYGDGRAAVVVAACGAGQALLVGAPRLDAATLAPWLRDELGADVRDTCSEPALTPIVVAAAEAAPLECFRSALAASASWVGDARGGRFTDGRTVFAVVDACDGAALGALSGAEPTTLAFVAPGAAHAATPSFSLERYFAALRDMRATAWPWRGPRGATVLSDLVLYGEVMRSTQTLLEDHAVLRRACPLGTTAFAAHQVAGRGRGPNAWISPRGCIQCSTLVALPAAAGAKAVFLQYLAALAIVHGLGAQCPALRGRLRIKWPNDVYARVPADAPGAVPSGGAHHVKVGGILVRAFFERQFVAVVGCGVNCTNAGPMASAAAVAGASLTDEACAGAILAAFEDALRVFEAAAWDFAPFVEAYRAAWLHSDEEITLGEAGERVRVVGVSRAGLLRAVPLASPHRSRDAAAWSDAPLAGCVELQPDGNSFDMLRHLVRQRPYTAPYGT